MRNPAGQSWRVALVLYATALLSVPLFAAPKDDFPAKLKALGLQDKAAEEALLRLYDTRAWYDVPSICNGRLTTESGVAVSSSDRTAQGTLYFTPYQGSMISLYYGGRWRLHSFSEISLALSVASGSIYDVFIYNSGGTLTLELSAAWTNDTTRNNALTTVDGVLVESADTTRRYLGTIRGSGANQVTDSATRRFVWNYYNRVHRLLSRTDTTSHSYASTTLRPFNGASNPVEWVVGETQGYYLSIQTEGNASSQFGIGLDSTTVATIYSAQSVGFTRDNISDFGTVTQGYHYAECLEAVVAGTVTFVSNIIRGNVRG